MRRAQYDENSQPHRNLLLNPALETATGTNVVVRTNLAYSPRQTNTNLGGYGTQTATAVTGLSGVPEGITTAVRVSYSAGATNAGTIFLQVPDVSSQYTVSAWVYNEGATSESIGLALKGHSSGGTQVVPQGVWTQLTWTMNTPASLGSGNDYGVRIGTTAAAGSFLTTGVLIEKAVGFVGAWFDGSSATAGDWNHAWTGTANASSSVRRGILPANIGVSGTAAIIHSGEWSANGTKSLRIIHTPSTTIAEAGLTDTTIVKPGKTYTILGKCRIDTVATTAHTRSRRFNFYWSTNGGANYTEANGPQAPNVVGVYDLRYTFTVPADATNTLLRAGGQSFGTTGVYQADIWWDNLMLVEGTYDGDYIDGSKPFSKWDGTANGSSSVGYPPQLLDIAGPPAMDKIGSGNTTNPTVNGFAARTIYLCYEVMSNNASWQVPVYYGSNAPTDGVTFQTAAAPTNTMSPRFDFTTGGGDINKGLGITTARTPNRIHVMAVSLNQGLTLASFTTDGSINNTLALNPGSVGLTSGQLRCFAQATIKNLRAMVYYADHDLTTRVAISRYLGNKYGAAVA